jgi:hypothetical protein
MMKLASLSIAALVAGALLFPGGAQAQADKGKEQAPPASGDSASAPPETTPDGKTVSAPGLAVASVRLSGGYRASKVIGAAVDNAQNQQIGTVDDIVLDGQNKAAFAVISVGGFLGVGGKLVALPYGDLQRDNGKVVYPNGTKEALGQMPSFTYNP